MSKIEVHTITKPVWDLTGGEKRKHVQKDHPEFLIDIVKKSDFDRAISLLKLHLEGAVEDAAVELREQTEQFLEECK